jgi:hypothetical protein
MTSFSKETERLIRIDWNEHNQFENTTPEIVMSDIEKNPYTPILITSNPNQNIKPKNNTRFISLPRGTEG